MARMDRGRALEAIRDAEPKSELLLGRCLAMSSDCEGSSGAASFSVFVVSPAAGEMGRGSATGGFARRFTASSTNRSTISRSLGRELLR